MNKKRKQPCTTCTLFSAITERIDEKVETQSEFVLADEVGMIFKPTLIDIYMGWTEQHYKEICKRFFGQIDGNGLNELFEANDSKGANEGFADSSFSEESELQSDVSLQIGNKIDKPLAQETVAEGPVGLSLDDTQEGVENE